jgi:hypothetical protein
VKKTDPAKTAAVPFADDGRPTGELTDSELADAYFDRKSRVDAFAGIKDRCEALGKEARRRFEDAAADQKFELRSPSSILEVGMKQMEGSVSIHALFKVSKLKIVDFLDKCKISLTEAKAIPGGAELIVESRTGWRPLKAIKRMPVTE